MARETVVKLTDDLDGSAAAATVKFALDGLHYEIDLSEKNDNALRTTLNPFIEAARRVRPEPTRGGRALGRPVDKERNQAVRRWALEEGVELPSRGRIAGGVLEAFDAKDVAALYAAAGLEMEPEEPAEPEPPQAPKRGRRKVEAEFSQA
jgi:hypothetical protein